MCLIKSWTFFDVFSICTMLKETIYGCFVIWIFSNTCLNVSSENAVCESPWEHLHNSCILFMGPPLSWLNWQQARDSCLRMDSDLLTIDNEPENKNISNVLNRYAENDNLYHYWWIGIRHVNDTWQWIDKEKIYKNIPAWAPNQPNDTSRNKCGMLEYQGYLSAQRCWHTGFYICEQKLNTQYTTPHTSSSTVLTTVSSNTSTAGTSDTTSTPHTSAQSTNSPVTNSTGNPGEQSTDTYDTTSPSTANQSTTNKTEKPPEITTDDSSSTSSTTEIFTDISTKQITSNATEMKTANLTGITSTWLSSKTTPETSTDSQPTEHQTDKQTSEQTDSPSTGLSTDEPEITTENTVDEKDKFVGCFAVNYESTCPPVEAFGISWPRSKADEIVIVPCDNGMGHANWTCAKNPTCWRGEADVKDCTSESIKDLTNQMEEFLSNTSNSEKAVEFTENLASSVEKEDSMTSQDIFQSTKLMAAASNAEPKNSSDAKNIIKNVAKCGSNLVKKKETWDGMDKENQRTIASSLLNSMESVTNKMVESFDEPTVETIVEENMAIELQIIDVNGNGSETNETQFHAESNSFTIPKENLKQFSKGGMARLVFINYNSVGEFLVPSDDSEDDNASYKRLIISEVISASLNEKPVGEPLVEPVVFTMKTEKVQLGTNQTQLCSFWNFNRGYTGEWSQEGCFLKENNDTHTTCQCDHLTNFAILMDVHSTKVAPIHAITLSYITYTGIIISIICLFLSWITFVCLRSTQGERNSIHKNLAFCLFIAEVLFLFGIERTDNKVACAVIAGFLHYFFLASFTWMFVEGIHIVFMLVQVFDAARSRLKYYYLIGYVAPLLVIAISALVYYEGYGTDKYCWLSSERSFIWSFAGPLVFILLVNLVVLIYAMNAVCKHSEYVFTKDKSMYGNFKAWIQGAMAMEILLGLTWIFGYFYISEEAIPMAYLFTIFNSFQGVFIFVFHCLLNKKVRKAYVRFIDYPRRVVTSSSSGTHSTKASSHSMSSPVTPTYHRHGTRKHSKFLDIGKDRRPSSMSTTSA